VAAAGNQGTVGSTAITRHPCVIAVAACARSGTPLDESNFGNSIGRRGLSAPGEGITSLGTNVKAVLSGGTSVAAPFVTGAIALAWSQFPQADAGQVRVAVTQAHAQRRPTVIPALLNAWANFATLRKSSHFRSLLSRSPTSPLLYRALGVVLSQLLTTVLKCCPARMIRCDSCSMFSLLTPWREGHYEYATETILGRKSR
jgi:hypothetical protein